MKQLFSRGTLWLVTLAALAAALTANMHARALGRKVASPTAVAVVDWLEVTNKAKEWQNMLTSLNSLKEKLLEQDADWQKKMSEMKQGISALPPESTVRREEEEKYLLQDLQYQAWQKFRDAKLQTEQARLQVRLYHHINAAVEKVAKRDGWAIVLWNDADDSKINENNLSAAAELMTRRKVLFADADAVDITDEVAVLMNNEFDASGGARGSTRTGP